jgi:uncharacterized protein YicC (UPF0701 family)
MIRSMTGFVTKRKQLPKIGELKISLRSVNYKYLDVHIAKIPWEFEEIDKFIYQSVVKKIKRGRIDIAFWYSSEGKEKVSAENIKRTKKAFKEALTELIEFKLIQGENIKKEIEKLIKQLIKRSDLFKQNIKNKAAVQAETNKDIFEEVSLTAFYLKHLNQILRKKKGGLGKILDFFSQELLRETNTILAKNKDKAVSLEAVYFKEEVDRLRELAQNIE